MRLVVSVLFLSLGSLAAQESGVPVDSRGWINKGVQEFKGARYQDAVQSFQKAVDLNPSDVTARLYLASAWMSQYIPGAEAPENVEAANKAEVELRQALQMESNNAIALSSLASLMYQVAQGIPDQQQKFRKLDESASWYEKLIAADPRNKEAYYSLAVIDWAKWYAAWMQTRAALGMKPEDPGPLREPARQELKQQYSPMIEHGISNLAKALEIDPQYDDAMAYTNLFIRERADFADTPEQYRREIETADQWVENALETKKMKAQAEVPPRPLALPGSRPQRIRVGGNVQAANLIRKVQPVYPMSAKEARVQGVVRFTAVIGHDGNVQHLQLMSGHPLLVDAAREAVSQWVYKPTLLNGSPVEVVTLVDVNFTLTK